VVEKTIGRLRADMEAGRVTSEEITQAYHAVVYPGLLSDVSLNDGGGGRAAFGRRDTPGAANGTPTIVIPAGINDHGQPVNIQLMGRAWDDPQLVGYAYAFERQARAAGSGHMVQKTAPPLRVESRGRHDDRDDDWDDRDRRKGSGFDRR
jgi:hypothetical protein